MIRSAVSQILVEWAVALNAKAHRYTFDYEAKNFFASHQAVLPLEHVLPVVGKQTAFSYDSQLKGAVEVESNVLIGHGSYLNGNNAPIRVGSDTVIGEHVAIYTKELYKSIPGSTNIGRGTYIGDKTNINSTLIDDDVFVGENCYIGEGSILERGSVLLPGSVVQPGTVLESGKVYAGTPAKPVTANIAKYQKRLTERLKSARDTAQNLDQQVLYIKAE